MKQCPFCGTKWKGKDPCPNCGLDPENNRDESMFQPSAEETGDFQDAPPDFEVEELLRWEPSSQDDAGETEEKDSKEQEEPFPEEGEEEEILTPRRRWRLWQKLATAAVAVAAAAALVIGLWPKTPALPREPAFFVKDNTLMVLPADGEPQKLGEYIDGMEATLAVSPDHRDIAWTENETVKRMALGGEAVAFSQAPASYPKFSQDGKYLYCMAKENEEKSLYQIDVASGQERKVGPMEYYAYWEDGSLLAVQRDSGLDVYDLNTLEKRWSNQVQSELVGSFDGSLYYLERVDDMGTVRMCRRKGGEMEELLTNVTGGIPLSGGGAYLLECTGEEVPLAGLLENDIGADGEEIIKELEGRTVRIPKTSLYCLRNGQLTLMGDSLNIQQYDEKVGATLAFDVEYQAAEETRFPLSDIQAVYGNDKTNIALYVEEYISIMWPRESTLRYLVKDGKLFTLPEDVPQSGYSFQIAGDWMSFCHNNEDTEKSGLWLGRIEGETVVSQGFYSVADTDHYVLTDRYLLTSAGKVYYWSVQANQFSGTIYENGVPLVTDVNLQNVQTTQDGAVYFLSGSAESWTLNRVVDGKVEALAKDVDEFTAFTRDYALALQRQPGKTGYGLLVLEDGKEPRIAAQQVETLFRSQKDRVTLP